MTQPSPQPEPPADGSVPQVVARAPANVDFSKFQQADCVELDQVPVLGPEGESMWHPTPEGVVLISQTCDLVQANKETAQVAPLVRLESDKAKRASKGGMPQYVGVPAIGPDAFADLGQIATVHKAHVAGLPTERGVASTQEQRAFGMRVGRRYSRFAFPDEVVPWLSPLKDVVLSKAGKGGSPLGRVLDQLVESLRLECTPDWDRGTPYQLTLIVIVKAELLPFFPEDDVPDCPPDLAEWLYGGSDSQQVIRKPAEVAQRLLDRWETADRSEKLWLWEGFADSLAALCRPALNEPAEVLGAVVDGQIGAEVATARDVTYERILRSEEIDVEHLSPPLPR